MKNKIKTIGIIGSLASIIGLFLYFIPSEGKIQTTGNQSPIFYKPTDEVEVNYDIRQNHVIIDKEKYLNHKEITRLRKTEINYFTEKGSSVFDEKLFALVDGKTYELRLTDEKDDVVCIAEIAQEDFDGNGSLDVLITQKIACEGNCCGYSFFFYSYFGDGYFVRSSDFGYSWDEPEIEMWKGRWSVIVTSEGESSAREFKERFIIEGGEVIKVEDVKKQKIVTQIEIKAEEFDYERDDEVKRILIDLDGDGFDDEIECVLWHRWLQISWKVKFSSGKEFDTGFGCRRIGVLHTKTNGVYDLVCGIDSIFKWNGEKYEGDNR